jgi:nitrite reductase (NO-forming)
MVQQAFAQQEDIDDDATVKNVLLIANEHTLKIAPDNPLHPGGIEYSAMTFNGTIPGPAIAADVGDVLNITVRNEGQTIHSLDFHAGIGPSDVLSGNIAPGETVSWTLTAHNPGAFMYHCGADALNGVWEHVANGMYGAVIIHPEDEEEAKEFYLSFGEIYNSADGGLFVGTNGTVGTFDLGKWATDQPDLILTNGMAHKYVPAIGETAVIPLNPDAELFQVTPGELTRWYVLSPGPNQGVSFHFISGQIDVRDGSSDGGDNYGTQVIDDETWWIPPGSASVIESTFPEEGVYVGVDHNMNHVVKGAAFAVLATPNSTATDHPAGTCVAPKGSESVVADWCPQPASTNVTEFIAEEEATDTTDTMEGNATDAMQNATLAFAEKTNMTDSNSTDMMQNATLAFAEKTNMTDSNSTDMMQNATLAFAEEGEMMKESEMMEESQMIEDNSTDMMQNATLAFAEKTNMTDDSMQNATLAFAEKKKHD